MVWDKKRKRWLKQVLKNIRKSKKVARNPKRKDCGTMEENGGVSSSIKLYKIVPMIYSARTAKTEQFREWGKVKGE